MPSPGIGGFEPQASGLALIATPSQSDAKLLWRTFADLNLLVHHARCYRQALAELLQYRFTVVLTDLHLGDGCWKDILSLSAELIDAPRVVLLASGVDAGLCAEAANLGAYDVLARPLREDEIRRVGALAAWGLPGAAASIRMQSSSKFPGSA